MRKRGVTNLSAQSAQMEKAYRYTYAEVISKSGGSTEVVNILLNTNNDPHASQTAMRQTAVNRLEDLVSWAESAIRLLQAKG